MDEIKIGKIVPGSLEPVGETTEEMDEIGRAMLGAERYDALHGIGGAITRQTIKNVFETMIRLGYRKGN